MKKQYSVKSNGLRLPLTETVVTMLVLDRLNAPGYAWIITLIILAIVNGIEIFEKPKNKDGEKESSFQEKLNQMAKERGIQKPEKDS